MTIRQAVFFAVALGIAFAIGFLLIPDAPLYAKFPIYIVLGYIANEVEWRTS